MTPQQIDAMKLALGALEIEEAQTHYPSQFLLRAITAIKEALAEHAMREVQRLGQEIEQEPVANDPLPRACNLAGVDYQTFLKIKAYMPVIPPQRTKEKNT